MGGVDTKSREGADADKLANFPKPWVKRDEPVHIEDRPGWYIFSFCECRRQPYGICKPDWRRLPAVVFGTKDDVIDTYRNVVGIGPQDLNDGCPACGGFGQGGAVRKMYIPPPRSES